MNQSLRCQGCNACHPNRCWRIRFWMILLMYLSDQTLLVFLPFFLHFFRSFLFWACLMQVTLACTLSSFASAFDSLLACFSANVFRVNFSSAWTGFRLVRIATDIMASKETVLNIFFNRSGWINIARSWFSNHGSWRNEVVQSFWLALIFCASCSAIFLVFCRWITSSSRGKQTLVVFPQTDMDCWLPTGFHSWRIRWWSTVDAVKEPGPFLGKQLDGHWKQIFLRNWNKRVGLWSGVSRPFWGCLFSFASGSIFIVQSKIWRNALHLCADGF